MALSGDVDSFLLSGLSPNTEYEVMLQAVFKDQSESDAVLVVETTRERIMQLNSFSMLHTAVVQFSPWL